MGHEHVVVTTEEVRRAEDATPLAFVPVRHHAGVAGLVGHDDTKVTGTGARARIGSEMSRAVLEEGVSESHA